MRGRDFQVSVVAVSAAFLALRNTPAVDIETRWILSDPGLREQKNPVPVPLPLVTDLDGDGRNEVLLVANGGKTLRVISVPLVSGEMLVEPWIKSEVKVASKSHAPDDRRIVAIAAGYFDVPQDGRTRQKHVVIVREDWVVACYDHELEAKTKMYLNHNGKVEPGGSYAVDQVAITVVPVPIGRRVGEYPRSVVIVGGSLQHRDGHHHASTSRNPADGRLQGEDPLGVHVEAFVEGKKDSAEEENEEMDISARARERRETEHFWFYAMDMLEQTVLWSQTESPTKDKVDHSGHSATKQQEKYKLSDFKDLGPNDESALFRAGDVDVGDRLRRYRKSLLRHLPHSWSGPVDTRMYLAILDRVGNAGGTTDAGNRRAVRTGSGMDRHPSLDNRGRLPSGVKDGQKAGMDEEQGGGKVLAVVAHTRDGIEAVEVANGKPISAVMLPAAASGAGVYADLNGDHVVDHVQAVGTRGGHGWEHLHSEQARGHLSQADKARGLPPCYALAVSGLPPREHLFNGSLCHDRTALSEAQMRLNSRRVSRVKPHVPRDIDVDVASPVVLPRWVANPGQSHRVSSMRKVWPQKSRSDVVFAVSSGVVTSYDGEGRMNWQSKQGPTWARAGSYDGQPGGYIVPFNLEAESDDQHGGRPSSPSNKQYILVVGQDKMCIYDRKGRMVGSTKLVSAPLQRPVAGDFDGNGLTDFVIVGVTGSTVGYALAPDPGIHAVFVVVLVFIAAILVVAAIYVPPPASAGRIRWQMDRSSVKRSSEELRRSTD